MCWVHDWRHNCVRYLNNGRESRLSESSWICRVKAFGGSIRCLEPSFNNNRAIFYVNRDISSHEKYSGMLRSSSVSAQHVSHKSNWASTLCDSQTLVDILASQPKVGNLSQIRQKQKANNLKSDPSSKEVDMCRAAPKPEPKAWVIGQPFVVRSLSACATSRIPLYMKSFFLSSLNGGRSESHPKLQ